MAQPIDQLSTSHQPIRGIGWVLRGAFVLAVFSMVSIMFAQLLMLTIAEQHLIQAAKAGAREAVLPRATISSVTNVVHQRWRSWSQGAPNLHVAVKSEDGAFRRLLPEELHGSIHIEVTVPATGILPHCFQFMWGPHILHARASG